MERFDFYGFVVEVTGTSEDAVKEIVRDFAWFATPSPDTTDRPAADMRINLHDSPPAYETLPSVPASVLTPRNATFAEGHISYIDYFGHGLAVLDRRRRCCDIYSAEFDLLREIAYLFLLSEVGQHLDARRMHRIHAMGVNYNGRGILLLLPSGGGKSTMTFELLRHPEFTLLSEDTPLIDRNGRIHPFPLRLGVANGQRTEVPAHMQRLFQRMEFHPKTFVDLDFFQHRLSAAVDPAVILVGERNLGADSAIVPISMGRTIDALIKYLVVGLGVYQGLEFLLERGIWEMAGKAGVVSSRLRNARSLMSKAQAYKFVLGRDVARNTQTLMEFAAQRWREPVECQPRPTPVTARAGGW